MWHSSWSKKYFHFLEKMHRFKKNNNKVLKVAKQYFTDKISRGFQLSTEDKMPQSLNKLVHEKPNYKCTTSLDFDTVTLRETRKGKPM